MTQSTLKKSIALFVCILFTVNSLWSQISIYEIPLANQIKQSSQIVEGKVISKFTYWDNQHSNIYTAYTIAVTKVFKGNGNPYIDVIIKGGVIGLEAQIISHSLNLQQGEIGMFMLKDTKVNAAKSNNLPSYNVVSGLQGFYKYDINTNKAVNTFSSRDGISNNFYSEIEANTGKSFIEVNAINLQPSNTKSNIENHKSTAVIMTTMSAYENSAGTHSVLTINGSNFGTIRGSVEFSNANYGGYLFISALDTQILSWTDTEIEVEIPYLAGTGKVKVNTISNGSIESDDLLAINFSQINLETNLGSGNTAYQTQHVDRDANGGYTWIMNSDFNNNQEAADAFTRAFENWTCTSGVNWKIDSATTSTSTSANDGENVITFDSGLSSGVLGRSTSYYGGCLEGTEIKWYVTEIDIVFNPNKVWNYTTSDPLYNEIDFESVTLHELGHAHQLGHVVDANEVMHYSLSNGISKRTLSSKDLDGTLDIQQRSTETPICAQEAMTNSTCYLQALSNNDFELLNEIQVYPNPSKAQFFINNNTQLPINGIQVYNLVGELVLNKTGINLVQNKLDLSLYNKGIYIIKLVSKNATLSKKLIIY